MRKFAVLSAFGLWGFWTFATWYLEGRIETFSRPDAIADRLIYTFVANILVGIIGAKMLLRLAIVSVAQEWKTVGFGSWRRTAVWMPLGTMVGMALFLLQAAPSTNPIVILNAFAQVLVVSAAEVLVCWSVVAGILAIAINRPRWITYTAASIVASFLFGVYHLAHSAPFNTLQMIAFLSMIGLLTSVFFFISHDVYGTIFFHNFLGVFGVLEALSAQGKLATFETLQVPLIATALITLVILVVADVQLCRKRVPSS
jgi:hypothetical protein